MYVLHIQNFLYFKKIGISSRKIQIPGSALDVMNQTPWGQAFLPLNRFPQVILKPRVSWETTIVGTYWWSTAKKGPAVSVKGDSYRFTLSESTIPSTQETQDSCKTAGCRLGNMHPHSFIRNHQPRSKRTGPDRVLLVCGCECVFWGCGEVVVLLILELALRRLRSHPYFSHSTHHVIKLLML